MRFTTQHCLKYALVKPEFATSTALTMYRQIIMSVVSNMAVLKVRSVILTFAKENVTQTMVQMLCKLLGYSITTYLHPGKKWLNKFHDPKKSCNTKCCILKIFLPSNMFYKIAISTKTAGLYWSSTWLVGVKQHKQLSWVLSKDRQKHGNIWCSKVNSKVNFNLKLRIKQN